ncbi:MAG: NAAT family transporter [Gammaproteobacteria bacterium]|nr:NAAT family transporter [Gammaproteobacteria bacterium]
MNWPDIAAAAVTLFFIMDPLGNMPVANAILQHVDSHARAKIVAREMLFALVILMVFLWAGTSILDFMQLSQPSLSLAGGVLLFIIALRMIFPEPVSEGSDAIDDPFIVPLAMPMVAGPSTIAILLLLSSTEPDRMGEWSAALFIAWAGTASIMTASPYLIRYLGDRGARALGRFMGMLLVLLATQMLLNGVAEFVASLRAG